MIRITVPEWIKVNAKAITSENNSWFRCPSNFPKDPRLNALPVSARWFYLYLWALCTDASSGTIDVLLDVSWRSLNIPKVSPTETLRCLYDASMLLLEGTDEDSRGIVEGIYGDSSNRKPLKSLDSQNTNERTNERIVDAPKIEIKKPSVEEIKNHPAFKTELRFNEDFQSFATWFAEAGVDYPEIKRNLENAYLQFGSFEKFNSWLEQYKSSKAGKRVAQKSEEERKRSFKVAFLGECGLLTPKREVKP